MTGTPLGTHDGRGSPAAAAEPAEAAIAVPATGACPSAAGTEQALRDMRSSIERLQHGLRRSTLLSGLAVASAVVLGAVSAGLSVRSAAHLAAASAVHDATATALVDRIVRLDALAGKVEASVQETARTGPETLVRIAALQEHVDAGMGTLRQGLASLQQDLAQTTTRATGALEGRVLAAIADVGISIASLRASPAMPADTAALVARLEAAVAAVERSATPAPAGAARPAAGTPPSDRKTRPPRPSAPNPYSFP